MSLPNNDSTLAPKSEFSIPSIEETALDIALNTTDKLDTLDNHQPSVIKIKENMGTELITSFGSDDFKISSISVQESLSLIGVKLPPIITEELKTFTDRLDREKNGFENEPPFGYVGKERQKPSLFKV